MKLFVTSDADKETGLSELIYEINRSPMDDFFVNRFYDDSGVEMAIVLMCRGPQWSFKQRIRFVRKENCLYMDIMLDLDVMSRADLKARKRIVGEKIVNEIPQIIAKYKAKGKYGFKDFDLLRFSSDLREWFEQNGWMDQEFPHIIESGGGLA
ncbi:MAG: hypothetical protein LC113_07140 [Acidobacteria bacterium]|nr:hypothetical protein [Acidobacteriota bacterium]